jgi:hypothetical protein
MPLARGFTRFGGQIIKGVDGNELRKLTRVLRRQLYDRLLDEAEATPGEMLHMTRCGNDPVGMRKAVGDLYEPEWEKAGRTPRESNLSVRISNAAWNHARADAGYSFTVPERCHKSAERVMQPDLSNRNSSHR